jgi:PAS domain S-box-containing protein
MVEEKESRGKDKPLPRRLDGAPGKAKKPGYSKRHASSEEDYHNIFEAASDGLMIYDIDMGMVAEANPAACQMHGYSRQEFIGLSPTAFMRPESLALFREHIRSIEAGLVFESLDVHLRKGGAPFYAEVRRSMISYRGRPCMLSVARDVNQRIESENILSGQIEARRREQATLLAISHTLASTLELQPGLILDQLREIIEYTHGGLFALEEDALVALAMRGTSQLENCVPFRIPLDDPQSQVTLFNGHRPIIIADIWANTQPAKFLRSLMTGEAAGLIEGMQSWMWVPLAVRGRIIGGISVAESGKGYFSDHHANLALSVANQAAITMFNSELYEQAQALAVMEERQSLARNLHDAINQSLFSAGLIAEVLPRLWERDQVEARLSLEDLRRLTRGAQAEMRALLAELRPSTLTDSDLVDLLRLLGNALSGRTNIPVVITVQGKGILPAETQVAIYRVCQEALNNIAKHSKASQVEIDLRHAEEPGELELHIRDNGRGYNPSESKSSGHYGLSMMRERAEAVGADLTITSQPGLGTELTIRWNETPAKEAL